LEIEDAEFEEPPRRSGRSSGRSSTPPPAYYDDDEDIPDLPGRGWSPLRWLLLIVIVGGLALVATQWERVAGLLGIGSDPALIAAGVAEGDASLAQGHPEAYASAIEAYGRSIEAGGSRDPEILAKLSNAYALAAQAQIDDDATGETVESLTAAALTTAQNALEIDPGELDARLARADALRLAGEHAEARNALEEARSTSFSRTAEFFRIDARLNAAEADGNWENGLRSAKQAAELAPHEPRYLLLLARAEHAAGDDAGARAPLETILADHPEHPVANKLLAELDAVGLEADAGVAVDGGVEAQAESGAETGAESGTVSETGTETGTETGAEAAAGGKAAVRKEPAPRKRGGPKKPAYDEYDRLAEAAGDDAFVDGRPPVRDYEWYMRQGRAELAGGNYSRARAFFDSALEARPGSADAMDGLGRVSIGIEDFKSALRYFRVAAQRGHPDGYFNLGKTYERLGRNEEAVSAYYTYVKRRPTGTHAAAAKAAIKTLEPRAKLPPEPESDPEPQPGPESDPSQAQEPPQQSEPAAP
jgi:tetratricopeptide (TPR) repeat protein